LLAVAGVVGTNASFFGFLIRTRGIGFALTSVPLQLLHHGCAGLGFSYALLEYGFGTLTGRRQPARPLTTQTLCRLEPGLS
jgi:hypothetical protein